jgi:hypothetical protein
MRRREVFLPGRVRDRRVFTEVSTDSGDDGAGEYGCVESEEKPYRGPQIQAGEHDKPRRRTPRAQSAARTQDTDIGSRATEDK